MTLQRLCTIFMGTCLAFAASGARADPPAGPVSDSADVAKLFSAFCLGDEPSLVSLEARARALEGAIAVDHTVPRGEKRQEHYEAWVVRRGDSMYQITADEEGMAGGTKRAVACGVTAPQADGADLARTMATGLGLGAPFRRIPAIGVAGNSVFWNKSFGKHQARIHLAYGAQGQVGATIHMILPDLPLSKPPPG